MQGSVPDNFIVNLGNQREDFMVINMIDPIIDYFRVTDIIAQKLTILVRNSQEKIY